MNEREQVISNLLYMKRDCLERSDTDKTLDRAIALLKAQEQGWISVKDRLPDSNRFVLVCNDDAHMMIAQYIEETAQWQYKYINYDVDIWDDEEQGPVCWWAELPEPPKEE